MTDSVCPWCNKPSEVSPCPACGKRWNAPRTGRLKGAAADPKTAAQSLRLFVFSGLAFVVAIIIAVLFDLQSGKLLEAVLPIGLASYVLMWFGLCRLSANANLPGSSASQNMGLVVLSAVASTAAKLWLYFNPTIVGLRIAIGLIGLSTLFFFQRYLRDVAAHFDREDLVARCDQVLWGFVGAAAIGGFVVWSQRGEPTGATRLLLGVAAIGGCVLVLFGLDLTLRIAGTLESNAETVPPTD